MRRIADRSRVRHWRTDGVRAEARLRQAQAEALNTALRAGVFL